MRLFEAIVVVLAIFFVLSTFVAWGVVMWRGVWRPPREWRWPWRLPPPKDHDQ